MRSRLANDTVFKFRFMKGQHDRYVKAQGVLGKIVKEGKYDVTPSPACKDVAGECKKCDSNAVSNSSDAISKAVCGVFPDE